jgi:hypothetical protein
VAADGKSAKEVAVVDGLAEEWRIERCGFVGGPKAQVWALVSSDGPGGGRSSEGAGHDMVHLRIIGWDPETAKRFGEAYLGEAYRANTECVGRGKHVVVAISDEVDDAQGSMTLKTCDMSTMAVRTLRMSRGPIALSRDGRFLGLVESTEERLQVVHVWGLDEQ